MPMTPDDDLIVVPVPGEEDPRERQRIRESNDRDQQMERHGERSRHNEGYDEAADGKTPAASVDPINEE